VIQKSQFIFNFGEWISFSKDVRRI